MSPALIAMSAGRTSPWVHEPTKILSPERGEIDILTLNVPLVMSNAVPPEDFVDYIGFAITLSELDVLWEIHRPRATRLADAIRLPLGWIILGLSGHFQKRGRLPGALVCVILDSYDDRNQQT